MSSESLSFFDQPEARTGEVSQPELRVEKDPVQVVLRLDGGPRIEGELFLFPEAAEGRPLWKRVLAFLNESDRFFPLRTADGHTVLVARARVLELSLVHAAVGSVVDAPDLHSAMVPVSALLTDGSQVTGHVVIESDAAHERLSDFVARPEPFLYLAAACDTLVHKSSICTLRPRAL